MIPHQRAVRRGSGRLVQLLGDCARRRAGRGHGRGVDDRDPTGGRELRGGPRRGHRGGVDDREPGVQPGGHGGAAEGVGRLVDQAGLSGQGADLEPDLGGLAVGADTGEGADRLAVPVLGAFAVAAAPGDLAEQGHGVHADQGQLVGAGDEHGQAALVSGLDVAREVERLRVDEVVAGPVRGGGRTPVQLGLGQPQLLLGVLEARRVGLQHDGDHLGAQPTEVADPLGVLEQVQRPLGHGQRLGDLAGLGADHAGVPVRRGAGHRRGEPLGLGDGLVAQLGGLGGAAGHEQGGGQRHREADALLGGDVCRGQRARAGSARRRWPAPADPASRQIRHRAVAALEAGGGVGRVVEEPLEGGHGAGVAQGVQGRRLDVPRADDAAVEAHEPGGAQRLAGQLEGGLGLAADQGELGVVELQLEAAGVLPALAVGEVLDGHAQPGRRGSRAGRCRRGAGRSRCATGRRPRRRGRPARAG